LPISRQPTLRSGRGGRSLDSVWQAGWPATGGAIWRAGRIGGMDMNPYEAPKVTDPTTGLPAPITDDDEDDGVPIGAPVAMLLNLTGIILIVSELVKCVGCR
jgi:hypothetical protein